MSNVFGSTDPYGRRQGPSRLVQRLMIAAVRYEAGPAIVLQCRAGALTAVMVGTGANAGNLSPISAVGAMADALMVKLGLPGHEWRIWAANFLAHFPVPGPAYVPFRGAPPRRARPPPRGSGAHPKPALPPAFRRPPPPTRAPLRSQRPAYTPPLGCAAPAPVAAPTSS